MLSALTSAPIHRRGRTGDSTYNTRRFSCAPALPCPAGLQSYSGFMRNLAGNLDRGNYDEIEPCFCLQRVSCILVAPEFVDSGLYLFIYS